jgi:hypothetical protein
MNPFTELLQLVQEDDTLRQELLNRGELFSGYHQEMEALQIENGKKLEELIDLVGYPQEKKFADAAWIIIMHAISLPSLQKKILALFKDNPKLYPSAQAAMLEDRVLVFSGKKQKFGTQFDWDENGLLNPYPIENPKSVNERRKQVRLEPIELKIQKLRERAMAEGEKPPLDLAKHSELRENWMLRVGWISDPSEIDPAYNKYRK